MTTLQEELRAYDHDVQEALKAGALAGKEPQSLMREVHDAFRERFMDIIKRHNDAPVFRVPFPAHRP